MPVTGQGVVADNIVKFGKGFLEHAKKTMVGAVDILDSEITKNISISDHTQADLAKLGHPYASRHGNKGIPLHEPYWQIHKQSGKLIGSKKIGVTEASVVDGRLQVVGWVGLDESVAQYALYLIWGTSKMIPRDPLSGSLFEPEIQNRIKSHLSDNLRDMVFNFKGVETH